MKLKQLFFIALLFVTTSAIVYASQQIVQQPRLRITWEEHQDLCGCLAGILPHEVAFELIKKYGIALINDYDFIALVYEGYTEATFIERIAYDQVERPILGRNNVILYPWKAADVQQILEIPGVSIKGECTAIANAFSSFQVTSDQLKKVELLIHYAGAEALSPKKTTGNWLLVKAAEGGNIEEVKLLLEAGAVPNHDKGYGHTFFDLVKQKPGIKKVYEEFLQLSACKKEAINEAAEHLGGIKDLGAIVGDYFFSQPQISKTEASHVAGSSNDDSN